MPRTRKKTVRGRRAAAPLDDVRELENDVAKGAPAGEEAGASDVDAATLELIREHARKWSTERTFQTLLGLACSIGAELDLRALVGQILHAGLQAFQAERGVLFLGRRESTGLVPVLAVSIEGEELQSLERVSRTVVQAGHDGVMLLTNDALDDERLRGIPSVKLNQVRSILCVPLTSPAGWIGAVYADAKAPRAFPPDVERMARAFATLAGQALQNARLYWDSARECALLRQAPGSREPLDRLLGASGPLLDLRRRARIAAQMESPLLICGEPGTGRELLARAIHDSSARVLQNFAVCDCSAVHPDLLKGMILGRTGLAASGHLGEESGFLARAHRGTLYLANADSLGPELGDLLARFIARGAYRPMGGRRDLPLDVRVILGTSKDLEREVRLGRFSRDLHVRVQPLTLSVPALRDRPADIPELVTHFLRLHGNGRELGVSQDALQHLTRRPWPGNVEELEYVIRRLLAFARTEAIAVSDVDDALVPLSEEEGRRLGPSSGLILPLAEWEKEAVRRAIAHTGGNVSEAARLLGVHRNTMVRKVRELRE
jgi:DNA-binding NtrC family response regulator